VQNIYLMYQGPGLDDMSIGSIIRDFMTHVEPETWCGPPLDEAYKTYLGYTGDDFVTSLPETVWRSSIFTVKGGAE